MPTGNLGYERMTCLPNKANSWGAGGLGARTSSVRNKAKFQRALPART